MVLCVCVVVVVCCVPSLVLGLVWVWGELRSNEIDESSSAKVSKIDPGGGGETVKPMEEGGAWPDLPKRVGGASWLVTTS